MVNQDELNRKLLEDILTEIAPDVLGGIMVPKDGQNLLNLLDMPEIEVSKAKPEDIMKFAQFVASNLTYQLKAGTSVKKDGFVGRTVGDLVNASNVDMELYKNAFFGIIENPFDYFDFKFEPIKLSEGKKKELNKLLTPIYGTDHDANKSLKFKEDVVNNPGKYFSVRAENIAAEIYGKHKEKLDRMLADYAANLTKGPEQKAGDGIERDFHDFKTPKAQLQYTRKDWWRFDQIRKAIVLEKKTEKEYQKAVRKNNIRVNMGKDQKKARDYRLTTCLKGDYHLRPKDADREGLVELLSFKSLKEAVESGKYNREEMKYYNEVIRKYRRVLFREAVLTWGKQDIIENTAAILLTLLLGGYIGYHGKDKIDEWKGKTTPPPEPKIVYVEKPVEFTQEVCNDKCKIYFISPPAPECRPKTIVEYVPRVCPSQTPCDCKDRIIKVNDGCGSGGRRIDHQ